MSDGSVLLTVVAGCISVYLLFRPFHGSRSQATGRNLHPWPTDALLAEVLDRVGLWGALLQLLGEALRRGRGSWSTWLLHARAKKSSPPTSISTMVDPLTLRFLDNDSNKAFPSSSFRGSFWFAAGTQGIFFALNVASLLQLIMQLDTKSGATDTVGVLTCTVVACVQPAIAGVVRVYLHHRCDDQLVASMIYGRLLVTSVIIVNGSFAGLQHVYQMVNLDEADLIKIAGIWLVWLLVVRFQRIPQYHVYLAACVGLFTVFPSLSVLGAQQERLLFYCTMVFAEIVGHLIDLLLRRRYAVQKEVLGRVGARDSDDTGSGARDSVRRSPFPMRIEAPIALGASSSISFVEPPDARQARGETSLHDLISASVAQLRQQSGEQPQEQPQAPRDPMQALPMATADSGQPLATKLAQKPGAPAARAPATPTPLSITVPKRSDDTQPKRMVPLILPRDVPVHFLRMWSREPEIEQELSARMFRANYELHLLLYSVRAVAVTFGALVLPYVAMCELPLVILQFVTRRTLHRQVDQLQSHRKGMIHCVTFILLSGAITLMRWTCSAQLTDGICNVAAFLPASHHAELPPWASLSLAIGTWASVVHMALTIMVSSSAAFAVRTALLVIHSQLHATSASLFSIDAVASMLCIGGFVLAHLLEYQQRCHLLELLHMHQQFTLSDRPNQGSAQASAAIAHVFDESTLPKALQLIRVNLSECFMGKTIGRGQSRTVRFAVLYGGTPKTSAKDSIEPPVEPRQVAAKVLHREYMTKAGLGAIRRELELESQLLPHQNVMGLLGVAWSIDKSQVVAFYELCDGNTLRHAITSGATATWSRPRKLLVAAGIADGLKHLHSQVPPIIHRDLKPENILFADSCSEGEPKIADFGDARYTEGVGTLLTAGRGTPAFSAPEQLQFESYGTPADIWAFGCCLVCLSKDREDPYADAMPGSSGLTDSSSSTIFARVMAGTLVPALPATDSLHSFVNDCCQFRPEERALAPQLEKAMSQAARKATLVHLAASRKDS